MANASVEKPRLRFAHHVWSCVSYPQRLKWGVIGFGYTPLEAFNDWRARL